MVDVRHANARCVILNGVLCLLLRADEHHGSSLGGKSANEVTCLLQRLLRLDEIDNVDACSLAPNVASHLWVPAAGLVAEVHSGLKQLLHADGCAHLSLLWL